MQTLTAKAAHSNFDQLMDRCTQSHQPILITCKCTDAVLLLAKDWESIQETPHLLASRACANSSGKAWQDL